MRNHSVTTPPTAQKPLTSLVDIVNDWSLLRRRIFFPVFSC